MLWPATAALPLASSATLAPGLTAAGSATAAIGRSAAVSAAGALAMPAPQVCPSRVQMHSDCCRSLAFAGTWHIGGWAATASRDVCGKGVEPSLRRAISWQELSLVFAALISAAMPETTGAEKLVPML